MMGWGMGEGGGNACDMSLREAQKRGVEDVGWGHGGGAPHAMMSFAFSNARR